MLNILSKHEELLRPLILSHGGIVVKTIGDAFMLTFESPTNAVLCGLRMQAKLKKYNLEVPPEKRIEIRIAINSGEVEIVGNDVFGETVNLAARLEGVTDSGEIYFTEATYLVMNRAEVPTSSVGGFRFKGIDREVKVFRVVQDENLELYNKVLQSDDVFDKVTPSEESIPEGSFSSKLLHNLEQQKSLTASRRLDPLIWAGSIVLVFLMLGGGYLGYESYKFHKERSNAEELLSNGQITESLNMLALLKTNKPTDERTGDLLARAIKAENDELLEEKRYEEALRRIESYRKQYPHMKIQEQLVRDTRLAQIEHTFLSNKRRAFEMLEELAKEYPQDNDIKFHLAYHNAESGWTIAGAMRLYRELVESDPNTYKDNKWVLKCVEKYLATKYNSNHKDLDFISNYYYEKVKPLLLEHIGDPETKGEAFRRNAFVLLKKHDDLTPIDEFRFYTSELFYRTIFATFFREETFTYFERLMHNGLPADIRENFPVRLPKMRIFHSSVTKDTNRAMPILEAFFSEALAKAQMGE